MGDFYGSHAAAYSTANSLGIQARDINESRLENWKQSSLAFKTLDGRERDKKDADIKTDVESDVTKVDSVYLVGKTGAKAGVAFGKGFAREALAAGAMERTTPTGLGIAEAFAPSRPSIGKDANFILDAGPEDFGPGAFGSARKFGSAVKSGAKEAGGVISEAGEGTKLFGEGATAVKDLTGVEGVVAGALVKGGGETFAKLGAKGLGAVGTGLAVYSDVDNFINTGNIFNEKDAAGNVVKQNLGEDIGNVATIVGGALDVAAAFTGGALAPIAAAVNIFAAVDSAVSGIEQDKAEKEADEKGLNPGSAPPAQSPQAFAQFGILANQSHNPLQHIN
jgi:hypothetical protein